MSQPMSAPSSGQTVYEMLEELARAMHTLQVETESPEGSDSAVEAQKAALRRIGGKILQDNNGHIDVQFNLQGDTGGALVLLVSVDALYVPYNLG